VCMLEEDMNLVADSLFAGNVPHYFLLCRHDVAVR
jgi:hypothetical protein